jgi:glycosidase
MEGKEKQMAAKIEDAAPRTLAEASLVPRGSVHPSPVDWRDQILYQLLPDRFSDGREHERELFDPLNPDRFCAEDKAAWMAAGTRFTGGTIRGIQSKLDYLQALGVTTLWINPPWKQRAELETYHGYGIQDFLDIDPRFGTRQELRDLVDAAHKRDMYVILDVIFNHSGNNWFYRDERDGSPKDTMPYRFSPPYPIHGWRSSVGESIPEPIAPEEGVWPAEFQNPEFYTRAGSIGHWGVAYWEDPQSPDVEFRRGDFYDLKDMNLENDAAIRALARVYQYWIALTDCDGFRVDAVKHVSVGQSHKFCSAVHEYAQYIGKDNFFLTGEITDGSLAPDYVDFFWSQPGCNPWHRRLSEPSGRFSRGSARPDGILYSVQCKHAGRHGAPIGAVYCPRLGRSRYVVSRDKGAFCRRQRCAQLVSTGGSRRRRAIDDTRHSRNLLRNGAGV